MIVRYHRNFDKKFVKLTNKLQQKFKERRNLFLTESYRKWFWYTWEQSSEPKQPQKR